MRTIAMEGTEGLVRGMVVTDTGSPIQMPIGDDIKGRLFNVIGQAIDGIKQPKGEKTLSIHRNARLLMKIFLLRRKYFTQELN